MPTQSVYITRSIPDSGLAMLAAAGLDVRVNSRPTAVEPDRLARQAACHDAVICLAARARCRIFANCAVGYDNIDVGAARRAGIVVTHTPDVLTETTADLTWALILAAARRLGQAERVVRAGAWRGWSMLDFLGTDVGGGTIGVVGAGRIGTAVLRRARGFSMRMLYTSRRDAEAADALGARRVPLNDLLANSDVVTLHVPLGESTRHMIDAGALQRMKNSAILVNTARGAVIDEAALIAALREGRIAAAGLDVYESEPRVAPELLRMENVVLLPHIGSATTATRQAMANCAARNVIAVLRGQPPLTPIDEQ
jgi:glyoxylate reductase